MSFFPPAFLLRGQNVAYYQFTKLYSYGKGFLAPRCIIEKYLWFVQPFN